MKGCKEGSQHLTLTVTEGASVLGVARHTQSRVINGQAGISPDEGEIPNERLGD